VPGRSAKKVLGPSKAHRLESQGAAGVAVADFTAETAPPGTEARAGGNGPAKSPEGGGSSRKSAGAAGGGGRGSAQATPAVSSGLDPAAGGGSGLGQVLSQATSSTSGGLGWFLPLAIVLIAAWSIQYALRRGHRVD
jgi:hypothetical protein